jgi:hypothetical protein
MTYSGMAKMSEYKAPIVTELGTLSELTQTTINKTGVQGDVIVINGQSIPVPGSKII